MRVTLSFNLPEEQCECDNAVHADDWRGVVEDIIQGLRSARKYDSWGADKPKPLTTDDTLEWSRKLVFGALEDRGLGGKL